MGGVVGWGVLLGLVGLMCDGCFCGRDSQRGVLQGDEKGARCRGIASE